MLTYLLRRNETQLTKITQTFVFKIVQKTFVLIFSDQNDKNILHRCLFFKISAAKKNRKVSVSDDKLTKWNSKTVIGELWFPWALYFHFKILASLTPVSITSDLMENYLQACVLVN